MKLNKSAERVADILEIISKNEKPMGITEISKTLGIPKSSTFDLLYTLVDKGFLEIADENLKTFKLGIKLFMIGSAYLKKVNFVELAHPILEKIMKETSETVFLAVENNGQLVYLDKVEPLTMTMRPAAVPGSTNPMTCTGIGKALLAAYSNERVKEITGDGKLITKTKNSIDSYENLIDELEKIRARGYAIDDRESEEEIYCIAVPIYDYTNKPIAAVSISSLTYKMNENREKHFSDLLIDYALKISSKLGFLGNGLFKQV